ALPLAVVIGVGVAGGLRAIRMERALIHGHAAGEDDLAAVLAAGERMGVDVDRLILVRLLGLRRAARAERRDEQSQPFNAGASAVRGCRGHRRAAPENGYRSRPS